MKRIFAFFCAIALLFTSFPAVAVSAMQMDLVAKETDLIMVEPVAPELFPDRRPNDQGFKNPKTALEHNLPDGFTDYLMEHFGNCEESFSIEQFGFPYDRFEELMYIIWDELPELFHVYSLGCSYYESTGMAAEIYATYMPYADTAVEYDTCLDKMRSGAEYLLQDVKGNENLTNVEKALILHDRLAVWTEYDLEGASSPVKTKIHTAYAPLGEGAAVCQGYAMAYMYLLEQVGIESDYCSSSTLHHGWNVVYIDGVAYHVDVTWDDPTNGSFAIFNDDYGRVYHRNFLLSSDGIRNTGHNADDFNTAPNDGRYDGEGSTTWWRNSATAVQMIDNDLYYLNQNDGKVICADNGSTLYTHSGYSSSYSLSSAEGKLLFSSDNNVLEIDPKTGVSSVVYTPPGGYIEGMKYEKGKLHVQLNDGNGNSRRVSVDYISPKIADFTYTVENGEATITGYTGAGGDVTIPATLDGYPVTAIDDHAFESCKGLTSVTIPYGIKTIGFCAFTDCSNLTSLTVGDGVQSIGEWAFDGCTGLTGVYITDLAAWCEIVFEDSTSNPLYLAKNLYLNDVLVTDLIIPQGVTSVSWLAFNGCTSLTSVTVPSSVTTIDNAAFFFCPNLTTVTLPDSVTYIGEDAFGYCSNLTDIYYDGTQDQWALIDVCEGNECLQNATIHFVPTQEESKYTYTVENGEVTITGYTGTGGVVVIPAALDGYPVTTIGSSAFYACTSLTSVTIPDSVTTIADEAFYHCDNMTSLTIGDSVTTIGDSAFGFCESLTSVTIPDSVTTIGNSAFYHCDNLTSLTIGDSVTTIGDWAFGYCESLTSVTIPDSVTTISSYVFSSCSSLTSVTIPGSVTTIGDWAFVFCESLTSVTIPDSVTTIGDGAFGYCESLTSVTIPDSVTTISSYVFSSCSSLTSVTIPGSVTTIADEAFGSCYRLTDVYYDGTRTQWQSVSVGDGNEYLQNATIHFAQEPEEPEEPEVTDFTYTVENGEVTITGYTGTGGDITIPDTLDGYPVTTIGEYAFYRCEMLTGVTIPGSVTAIGAYAFASCHGLTGMTIPDGVTLIADSAFRNCSYLTGVVIPEGVTAIGEYAFYQCERLTGVTIPASVTTIGAYAFFSCYSLTNVTIPDSVTTIGNHAFYNCAGLTAVTIGDGVTTIGEYALACNDSLVTLTIGNGVTTIDKYAFSDCSGLTNVTIPDSVTTIGEYAFYNCDSLLTATIGNGVTTISHHAFYNCDWLTGVVIGNSVTTIGSYAFQWTNLTEVILPDGVTTIGDGAFHYCHSLTNVTIPASVTIIGENAFYWCNALTDVYYGGNADQWSQIRIHVGNVCLTDANIHFLGEEPDAPSNGDLDGSGTIDEDDVIYLLQHLLMPDDFAVTQNVDYDGSGTVDEDDVIYLLQHLLMPDDFPL